MTNKPKTYQHARLQVLCSEDEVFSLIHMNKDGSNTLIETFDELSAAIVAMKVLSGDIDAAIYQA